MAPVSGYRAVWFAGFGLLLGGLSACLSPTGAQWLRCPSPATIQTLSQYGFAVIANDNLYLETVAGRNPVLELPAAQAFFIQKLNQCDRSIDGDITNRNHWMFGPYKRHIAIAKALELAMNAEVPFTLRLKQQRGALARYASVWNYLKTTGIRAVVLSSHARTASCCGTRVRLANGVIVPNGAMAMPLFEVPAEALRRLRLAPNRDDRLESPVVGDGWDAFEMLESAITGAILPGAPHGDYVLHPEYAYISPRYVQLGPEGVADPRPEQLVRYNLDWVFQLYGTLVHEMAHRLVGPHDGAQERDSSLGLQGAFYVQATALAHLLDRQHRNQGTARLPLNVAEELSLLSVARSLVDGAFVTRPDDSEWRHGEFEAGRIYLANFRVYRQYCEQHIDERVMALFGAKYDYPRCWADGSSSNFLDAAPAEGP